MRGRPPTALSSRAGGAAAGLRACTNRLPLPPGCSRSMAPNMPRYRGSNTAAGAEGGVDGAGGRGGGLGAEAADTWQAPRNARPHLPLQPPPQLCGSKRTPVSTPCCVGCSTVGSGKTGSVTSEGSIPKEAAAASRCLLPCCCRRHSVAPPPPGLSPWRRSRRRATPAGAADGMLIAAGIGCRSRSLVARAKNLDLFDHPMQRVWQ